MPWAYFKMLLTVAETVELQSVMASGTRNKVTLVADRRRLCLSVRQEQTKKGGQLKLPAAWKVAVSF